MPVLWPTGSIEDCGISADSLAPLGAAHTQRNLALGTQAGLSKTVESFAGWVGREEKSVEQGKGESHQFSQLVGLNSHCR